MNAINSKPARDKRVMKTENPTKKEFLMSEYSTEKKELTGPAFQSLPKECKFSRGISDNACPVFDRLCDWLREWSPRSDEKYYEAVGIFILSTIAARRVSYDFGKTRYTNLLILLIGRTGLTRKSTVATCALELLSHIGLEYLLVPDLMSPQKLVNIMSMKAPENIEKLSSAEQEITKVKVGFSGQRGWLHDEFGTTFASMLKSEKNDSMFRKLFRQFDDAPEKFSLAGIARGTDVITRPYLSFLGGLTIADMAPWCRRGSALWRDGLMARMALISADNVVSKERFPQGKLTFPPQIVDALSDWHNRLGFPIVSLHPILKVTPPIGQHLLLPQEVVDAYYAYDEALIDMMAQWDCTDLDGNYVRFPEKAMRIAALFASLAGSGSIELRHWVKAREITEGWRGNLHDLYPQLIADSPPPKLSIDERVFRCLLVHGDLRSREIQQKTRIKKPDVEDALNNLRSKGLMREYPDGNTIRYAAVDHEISLLSVERRHVDDISQTKNSDVNGSSIRYQNKYRGDNYEK